MFTQWYNKLVNKKIKVYLIFVLCNNATIHATHTRPHQFCILLLFLTFMNNYKNKASSSSSCCIKHDDEIKTIMHSYGLLTLNSTFCWSYITSISSETNLCPYFSRLTLLCSMSIKHIYDVHCKTCSVIKGWYFKFIFKKWLQNDGTAKHNECSGIQYI